MNKARHHLITDSDLVSFLEFKGNAPQTRYDLVVGYNEYCWHLRDESLKMSCGNDFLPFWFKTPFRYESSSYDFSHLPYNVVGEMYEFENDMDRAIREEIVLKNGALDAFIGEIESRKYRYGE